MSIRFSSFKSDYVPQARKLAKLGATNRELAEFFDVSIRTIGRWILNHPEFARAVRVGKAVADDRVEASLYKRAVGYSYDCQKVMMVAGKPEIVEFVEHLPPDINACNFWLRNRRPKQWNDKQKTEVTGQNGGPIIAQIERVIVEERDPHKRGQPEKCNTIGQREG
ncbi:MAG: helix-turn-helix domain-containing protein [Zymomonas mobilis subsp. pomaceae]|uniref:Uncharacterized protein n=1 Tax=Zymomonas mobilis subsp. pomaceae (strain ATCC 29192 / DSM 22645 / JCM 10191 / CCUG 17912 / NBRC 13757 / NCIMB 11200 / NRRL B-4491 / Barker I) TaxID=579138 RepID=F8ESF0_ZYMMT|nr:hypothetical protein [Zymomonas mobilis]AEI37725.1 hypothetical protein Zymop_0824 [Zymomonas mobilis subsp. pomaceae ATCC 29192]MDX5949092.1 helix-turn-helix domain-containing protein [Zymomonas mobilis subsp. pomaceae]GEB88897.1 hypothetical protein ZMO02_05340 [Zymomonas mobilis subsp. pomaceae]